ncbi:hotdog domain-containing protein [Nocardia sp. BMG111209]|uniref:PaaI family thioesterase n=1 Tax=Nocardia sp. BMG111209 TaxID=1160137 RepID=UPI00036BBDB2|nr:hotdog domain-containing protein [Nocardia sp. BMG111209]
MHIEPAPSAAAAEPTGHRRHLFRELGFATTMAGDELHGSAVVTPHMHVPGTARLRTSILAAWADSVTGLLASLALRPRVPVTVDLDVQLIRPAPADGRVDVIGAVAKTGRSIFVATVEFRCDTGLFGIGTATFTASPNPAARMPDRLSIGLPPASERLSVPLAQRAGCERRTPGIATLPRTVDGLNFSNTISGGLLALAAEEAVLSLAPGRTLSGLGLHYLQAARVGPVVATATVHHDLGLVVLRDEGNDDKVTTRATARLFAHPATT